MLGFIKQHRDETIVYRTVASSKMTSVRCTQTSVSEGSEGSWSPSEAPVLVFALTDLRQQIPDSCSPPLNLQEALSTSCG